MTPRVMLEAQESPVDIWKRENRDFAKDPKFSSSMCANKSAATIEAWRERFKHSVKRHTAHEAALT